MRDEGFTKWRELGNGNTRNTTKMGKKEKIWNRDLLNRGSQGTGILGIVGAGKQAYQEHNKKETIGEKRDKLFAN